VARLLILLLIGESVGCNECFDCGEFGPLRILTNSTVIIC
jgi:hypothetical protein